MKMNSEPGFFRELIEWSKNLSSIENRSHLRSELTKTLKKNVPFDDYHFFLLDQQTESWESFISNSNKDLVVDFTPFLVWIKDFFKEEVGIFKKVEWESSNGKSMPLQFFKRTGAEEVIVAKLVEEGDILGVLCITSNGSGILLEHHLSAVRKIVDFLNPVVVMVRKRESIENEVRETKLLLTITKKVTQIRDLPSFLAFIMKELKPLFGFHDIGLFLLTNDNEYHYDLATTNPEISPSDINWTHHRAGVKKIEHPGSAVDWAIRVIDKNGGVSLFDFRDLVQRFPDYWQFPDTQAHEREYRDCLAASLKVGDKILGMFCINQLEKDFFRKEQFPFFKKVTDQLAVAIYNILATEDLEKTNREKEVLLNITEKVTKLRSLPEFAAYITSELKLVFNFYNAGLFLLANEDEDHYDITTLHPEISPSRPNDTFKKAGIGYIKHKGSLIEWMMDKIEKNKGLVLFDFVELVASFPEYEQFQAVDLVKMGFRDCLAANLKVGDKVIGMFCINQLQKDFFPKAQYKLFTNVTKQLAVAISNIVATEDLEKRNQEKATLLKITDNVTKLKNLPEFLHYVNKEVKSVFQFYDIGVFLLTPDGKYHYDLATLYLEISPSELVDDLKKANINMVPHKDSLIEYMIDVINQKNGVYLFDFNDLRERFPKYPQFEQIDLDKYGYRDCLASNLIVGDTLVGMFCINQREKDFFKPFQFPLFKSVTDQLAVAVSNIIALEDLKKRNQEKELQVNVINSLGQKVPWPQKLEQVIRLISEHLETNLVFFAIQSKDFVAHYVFERIGPKEYRIGKAEQFFEENDIKRKDYYSTIKSIPETIRVTEGDFEKMNKRNSWLLNLTKRYQVQSLLGLSRSLDTKGNFHMLFLSKLPDAYFNEDVELIEKIGPTLSLSLEKLLAYERVEALNEELKKEKDYLQEEVNITYNFHEMVGETHEMEYIFKRVSQVAKGETTVLILGETGTGKELIARAIHDASPRHGKPLVKLNCAALPEELVESELFGHEKGAFTGAFKKRIGKFELADNGTIFLDEIGELSLTVQAKLLRVIQEQEFEPLGSNQTVRSNFRLIAATNRNLESAIEEGQFRLDLYYRLNTFPILLPPLRKRVSDIPLLIDHYGQIYSKKLGYPFKGFTNHSKEMLLEYHWPGNVRELQNVVEQAVLVGQGQELVFHLIAGSQRLNTSASDSIQNKLSNTEELLTASEIKEQQLIMEKQQIRAALEKARWRVRGSGGAAELLGLKPTTLESRMKKLGILKR